MAKKSGTLNLIITIFLIIGGLDLGLKIWNLDLITFILRIDWLILSAYAAIGLSAIYELYQLVKN